MSEITAGLEAHTRRVEGGRAGPCETHQGPPWLREQMSLGPAVATMRPRASRQRPVWSHRLSRSPGCPEREAPFHGQPARR